MELGTTEEHLRRPIWLVGHSYPRRSRGELVGPLDRRHPTRHTIWTSVLESLQQHLFMEGPQLRLDSNQCYMFNAIAKDSDEDPVDWHGASVLARIQKLRGYIGIYHPPLIITFGSDVYGFVSQSLDPAPRQPGRSKKIAELGDAFNSAVHRFDPAKTNVLPLLHAVVARASWASIGEKFIPGKPPKSDYFEYCGTELAKLLLTYFRNLPVWCEPSTT